MFGKYGVSWTTGAICLLLLGSGAARAGGKDKGRGIGQPQVIAAAVKRIGNWKNVKGVTLALRPTIENDDNLGAVDAVIKAQHTKDVISIQVSWPDDTKSDTHKTRIWDDKLRAYKSGTDKEDRVALMFDMAGDFSSCMLAGKVFRSDVWHWKAARTAPAGLAHDKYHIYSLKPVHKKSKEFTNRGGKKVYIARVSDAGDDLYKANQPPKEKTKDRLPGYIANAGAEGSIADVKARAVHNGRGWTVTMTRELDTGHDDDVVFEKGKTYRAAVACFDRSGDMDHSVAGFVLVIK